MDLDLVLAVLQVLTLAVFLLCDMYLDLVLAVLPVLTLAVLLLCDIDLDLVLTVVPVLTLVVLSATLVILVVQAYLLRRSLQSAIYHQIVDQNLHLNEVMLGRSLGVKRALLNSTEDDVTKIDTDLIAESLIDHYENVFVQHRLANLPKTVWPGWEYYMLHTILKTPVLSDAWLRMKDHMDAGFVSFVKRRQIRDQRQDAVDF
ncbi:MAG: hypothetical protein V3T84_08505 [Phycisphaerales bacterium]